MTVDDVIGNIPVVPYGVLPAPQYSPTNTPPVRVALAVASMKHHMTDEGWQVMQGLEYNGYHLRGHRLPFDHLSTTDVNLILDIDKPSVVVVQDKREWDVSVRDFRDPRARFQHIESLADRPDIFKVTILKDVHQKPHYHLESAREMGCHGWIVYYHPRIVKHLAPYVRQQDLVRTYHSVDPNIVPSYSPVRTCDCLLSGAISSAYPLRKRLVQGLREVSSPNCEVSYLQHPGYHRNGCATPGFLQTLSKFKVAICTASIYGYALRKIIEATASGCVVVTDLPSDDVLPEIDNNLVRIDPCLSLRSIRRLLEDLCRIYDPDKQQYFSDRAKLFYDYKAVGRRLASDIETLRLSYAESSIAKSVG